ncbi:MAG: SBBP repeat-containing protein, partial [Chloroflexales bacterium]|nr:SBBP repeat-containing protein [Chloroflexales bacterium]
DPDGGSLDFGVYLGGSGTDTASGLAVDSSDRVYLVGRTTSTDFPMVNPLQTANAGEFDFVVARLSTDGTLEYSTYLGGSGNENRRDGGIALNAAGEIYVLGATASTDFPTTPGVFQEDNAGGIDLFVTKLNAAGTEILFSTYVGGSANDQTAGFGAHALVLDSEDNIYITGLSRSDDFPTTPGAAQPEFGGPNFDGIVAKIAPDGSDLIYSTYLGGSAIGGNGNDFMSGIAVDATGNVYVTGHVHAIDFPLKNAIQPSRIGLPVFSDANITKLKPDGSLDYSTFFGGSQNEWGHDIEVDENGTAYVLLYSASDDVPLITPDTFQPESGGEIDLVIAEVSSVLQVSKVGAPRVAEANSPVTYTLTVENSSPQPVTNAVLTDTLPADMTLASVISDVSCTEEPNAVVCDLGDLDIGDLVTTTLVVTTPMTVGPPLINRAEVTAQHPDPDLGLLTYNVAEPTFFDAADVSVAIITPSPDENQPGDVGAGSPLSYTITVTNTGPDIATGVVLTSTLDAGMEFISVDPTAPVCEETEGVITCDLDTLAVDESTIVTIAASAPAERGWFQHAVAVASDVPDQDTTSNTTAASNFAEIYDAEVAVIDTTMSGEPPVFTYTLQLTNTSTWFATFDIAVTGNAWSTVVTPTEIIDLEYRSAAGFDPTAIITVTVTAPDETSGDSTDTATITITPRAAPNQPIAIDLTSRVAAPAPGRRLYLPIVGR